MKKTSVNERLHSDLFSVGEHRDRCPAVATCSILHDGGKATPSRRHEFGSRWKVEV